MGWLGNRDDRRINTLLGDPRTTWVLAQWAKIEVLRVPDRGVDPAEVIFAMGPVRILVQDARCGNVVATKVLDGLATLVQQNGGWVSVGVWRLLHQNGPARWLADGRIRSWFVDGLRSVAPANGGRQFPYQPYEDEEEFLRRAAGPHDPLWLFIPLRGSDLTPRTVPRQGEEPPCTELPVGEERRIAVISPHPDSNIMFATQREAGSFVAVIDAAMSNDDPTRTQFDLTFGDTLPNLYRRVGENLSTRTSIHWAHPELEPYFPYEYPPWRR
jgi:hypothetical protein